MSVLRQVTVADFYDLPKVIQEYLSLVREWNCNGCYGEIDVISDKDRDEWLERYPDEYTRANCAISNYFKAQGAKGAKEGTNTVVVLRTW